LQKILADDDVNRAIVFTKTKRGANLVAEKLVRNGIKATAIHGNKSQNARQRALDAFRRDRIQVLVATDVAARGIDIDGITHIVNFHIPIEPEVYVHRIGRTGRAGAAGIALSFCSSGERSELRAIEQLIGQKIPVTPNLVSSSRAVPAEPFGQQSRERQECVTVTNASPFAPVEKSKTRPRRPASRRSRSSRRRFKQTSF
jgi:ATP-dependent RNA helicase RhlE